MGLGRRLGVESHRIGEGVGQRRRDQGAGSLAVMTHDAIGIVRQSDPPVHAPSELAVDACPDRVQSSL
jgi:hypothetical protein